MTSKDKELEKIKKNILNHYQESQRLLEGFIHHARQCGEALIKAKELMVAKHGEWMPWVKDNVHMDYQTVSTYMRVAREWNDEAVRDAEEHGVKLDTINALRTFIKEMDKPKKLAREQSRQSGRSEFERNKHADKVLKKYFHTYLGKLPLEQKERLANGWSDVLATIREELLAEAKGFPKESRKREHIKQAV